MKIAIRDDDTSYYTSPNDLKKAFRGIEWFPISLSVVPFATYNHGESKPYRDVVPYGKYAPIGENKELISYIKEGIDINRFEVVQHGINHEYKKDFNGKWKPETIFLDESSLVKKMKNGKLYLEKIFNVNINVFAAPSNSVSKQCSSALDQLHMNTNSIISRHFDRLFSLRYFINYVKCNIFKFKTGIRYVKVLHFKNHKELTAFEFLTYDSAIKIYEEYKKYDFTIVFYTHYWDLNNDNCKQKELVKFLTEIVEDGANPVFLSECFKEK